VKSKKMSKPKASKPSDPKPKAKPFAPKIDSEVLDRINARIERAYEEIKPYRHPTKHKQAEDTPASKTVDDEE